MLKVECIVAAVSLCVGRESESRGVVTCVGHVLCCVTYLEKSTCARGCLFVRATFAWINALVLLWRNPPWTW